MEKVASTRLMRKALAKFKAIQERHPSMSFERVFNETRTQLLKEMTERDLLQFAKAQVHVLVAQLLAEKRRKKPTLVTSKVKGHGQR